MLADPVPAATTAAAVGVLVVVAAALAALGAPTWGATSGRHERAATGTDAPDAGPAAGDGAGGDAPDAHDDWDALSRGTDPSADR
ncbi:tryptophan-associated transmembrane protein [Isoptericola variabilis J7]|nr:tryptophan-associated transmembrane protein [Isoptericola variabilis J7]